VAAGHAGHVDVVEKLRIFLRAATPTAEAEDTEARSAGAGREVRAPQDDADVVACVHRRLDPKQAGSGQIIEGHFDNVEPVARRRRVRVRRVVGDRAAVYEQPVVRDIRHRRRRVGAAREWYGRDEVGIRLVGDVKDVHALEAGRDCLAVAGQTRSERPGASCRRIPGADEDVPEHDNVALVPVAEGSGDLSRVILFGDVADVEAVPIPLIGEPPLEGDVRVDVGVCASKAAEHGGLQDVTPRPQVVRARIGVVSSACRERKGQGAAGQGREDENT
jgi:hypothetical protein